MRWMELWIPQRSTLAPLRQNPALQKDWRQPAFSTFDTPTPLLSRLRKNRSRSAHPAQLARPGYRAWAGMAAISKAARASGESTPSGASLLVSGCGSLPGTHSVAPSAKCSRFQMGTCCFNVSIRYLHAAKASARCAAATPTTTLSSDTGTTPSLCSMHSRRMGHLTWRCLQGDAIHPWPWPRNTRIPASGLLPPRKLACYTSKQA